MKNAVQTSPTPATLWRQVARQHTALAALLLASTATQADTLSGAALSTVLENSASVLYSGTPSGVTMGVQELGTATMRGSDLFGFEGLWLGADQTGGGYSFTFSQPVQWFSLSFIALSFEDPAVETLTNFLADTAITTSFFSPDASLSWAANTLTPLDLDGRGVLTFTATQPQGLLSLRFDHLQADALNGFVINQIDFQAVAVPDVAPALSLALGLLCLHGLRRRYAFALLTRIQP